MDSVMDKDPSALPDNKKYGAPGETRTPNLLIRSREFTHSEGYYLGFCLRCLRHGGHRGPRRPGLIGSTMDEIYEA